MRDGLSDATLFRLCPVYAQADTAVGDDGAGSSGDGSDTAYANARLQRTARHSV